MIASASGLMRIGKRTSLVDTDEWRGVHPELATVYVENRCHLRCDHCYESEQSHPSSKRLSREDFARVLDGLKDIGVLFLTITGGEVFLRPDLLDLVEMAREKRFAVRLYTSGTLLTEAHADRIASLRLTEVHVSVYSHDAGVHDAFTGSPGSHAKSVRALTMLHERGVPTVMKANVMTINVDHLDELATFARSIHAELRLDPLVHPRQDGHPHPLKYLVPPEELKRKFLAKPHLVDVFKDRGPDAMCDGEAVRSESSLLCSAARRVVAIGVDGSVFACASMSVAAGNIHDDSLADIWYRSRQLDEMRRVRFGDMTSCGSCGVKTTCDPCMAHALIENGDIRECNASSMNLATSLRLLAEDRVRLSRGRSLPIVGDRTAPAPARATPRAGRHP